jgi:predicted ATP-binding protein involved in virulence
MKTISYYIKLHELGKKLRSTFPEIKFTYNSDANIWLTERKEDIEILLDMFEYRDEWKKLLDVPDLIIFSHDSDYWFGFTLD